jgi:hypothetical protein
MSVYSLRLAFLLFLVIFPSIKAQQVSITDFRRSEDSILNYFEKIKQTNDDKRKLDINDKIVNELNKQLSTYESFNYPFDSVKLVGKVYAPDMSFRIITWNLPLYNGNYNYFGFIQVPDKTGHSIKLFQLIDHCDDIPNPENSVLSAGKWFGSLCYKILKSKVDNKTYYTLLALRYNNLFISTKVIDVLFFDEWGNPVFGAPVFRVGDKEIRHRMIFKYSARASMTLRYDEQLKLIIFDHLAPAELRFSNQFEYYGPDLTFDGLAFQKDQWVYKTNIDLRITEEPIKPKKPISNGLFQNTPTPKR